jgi:hypothetical protein
MKLRGLEAAPDWRTTSESPALDCKLSRGPAASWENQVKGDGVFPLLLECSMRCGPAANFRFWIETLAGLAAIQCGCNRHRLLQGLHPAGGCAKPEPRNRQSVYKKAMPSLPSVLKPPMIP